MTLYEFNILSDYDKYQVTWDLGAHIDILVTKEHIINLYAIDKFFVEIYYNPEINKIEDVQSFKTGHSLDKYVNKLDI